MTSLCARKKTEMRDILPHWTKDECIILRNCKVIVRCGELHAKSAQHLSKGLNVCHVVGHSCSWSHAHFERLLSSG